MERALIIGAGAQGGPCASILAGESTVEEIRLGDIDKVIARRVAEKISSEKIKPFKLDAGNIDELVEAAQDVDVIFNLTHLKFNDIIMKAAVAVGAHYIDTACDTPFLENWISGSDPKFHREFIAIGKTALVGCGFAPGIANIFTRYICDQMTRVERIIIRAGRANTRRSDEVVSAWKPTWSPEILLEDYAEPPMLVKDGKFLQVPIFSNPEVYKFPQPIDDLLLSSHMHEEPYLIPKFYLDKGLKEIDFKYPVDKTVGAFIKMGFAGDEAIEVNGNLVVPRDVLMKLVKRPGNAFLQEDEQSILNSDLTGILDVTVDGERKGEKVTHLISYKFTDGLNRERINDLYREYGTTLVYVALPAVVGAKMCMRGDVENGVISPDSLDPYVFFEGMAERGVKFEFDETVKIHNTVRRR